MPFRSKISEKLPDRVTGKLPERLTTSKVKAQDTESASSTPRNESPTRSNQAQTDDDETAATSVKSSTPSSPAKSTPVESTRASISQASASQTSTRHSIPQDKLDLLDCLSNRKYVLASTCGPSYDSSTHQPLSVNSPFATTVSNDHVTCHIKLRIRNFAGLPLSSQSHTPYFESPAHAKDQYSIAFSFVPKHDIPSVDCRWGNDFDHPISDRLPPGFNTAFKIVKEFIDPGLACDAYAEQPWVFGPATSCWFKLRVGEEVSAADADAGNFPAPDDDPMPEDGVGSGTSARTAAGLPADAEKRRKHSLTASNRQTFIFEKGRWYMADFYNPYLDFNNFALKLPGFSLNVVKYINDKTHQLRYVFKNVGSGEVYFCVVLTLLFGEELKGRLEEARRGLEEEAGHGGDGEGQAGGGAEEKEEFHDAVENLDDWGVD